MAPMGPFCKPRVFTRGYDFAQFSGGHSGWMRTAAAVSWVCRAVAADFSRLISAPFSCMSQFSCSSVMPGILFFTSSRFMVETPFVGCDHSFIHCSLSVFGLGRGTHRLLRGTVWRHRTSRFRFWRPALFPNELRRHEKSTVHFLHSALDG